MAECRTIAKSQAFRSTPAEQVPDQVASAQPELLRTNSQTNHWLAFLTTSGIHPKLSVSSPGDADERAADALANEVMRGPASEQADRPAGLPAGQMSEESSGPSGEKLLAKSDAMSPVDESSAPALLTTALHAAGNPLSSSDRAYFEPRFGRNLEQVRVHVDEAAAEASRQIGAQAFAFGSDIYFGAGRTPGPDVLTAHELAHVVQAERAEQGFTEILHRYPAAPRDSSSTRAVADRSMVDVSAIPDIDLSPTGKGALAAKVTFNNASIVKLGWELYDASDTLVDSLSTTAGNADATSAPFSRDDAALRGLKLTGRCLLRCVGFDAAGEPVSFADRQFWVWTTTPTATAPDIAALESKKATLEKIVGKKSKKGFSEVGKAFAELDDTKHDLAILKTGTGTHVGNQCAVQPAGATPTDCTNIVMQVLESTFRQQKRGDVWDKVKKKLAANTKLSGRTGMSGLDVQAALQSEAGWKGIYWAPDPNYQIPKAELVGANSDEASFTSIKAGGKSKSYYKDNPKKGYPGVTVSQKVTNYAPETPNTGFGTASTTTKDTTQLDKLKKLTFGVLAAHGGYHMTLITNGKVLEVHWSTDATNPDLIEQTDLESWAVGANSGYHYYASGVIVAPAEDVDAAFK